MSTSRFWRFPFLLALLLGGFTFLTLGQEAPAEGTGLRVGVSPIFPPMVFKQAGQLVGVEVELARAFGKHLGRRVEFVELPWEEQIPALQDRRIDIVMSSMSITPARSFVVDFSQSYLTVWQAPLVRREDQYTYVLGIPLQGKGSIGVLEGTTGDFLVQRDYPKMRRKTFRSEADAVKALKKKKIDLFISDSTLVWYLAGMHANDGLAAVPIALSKEPVAWGLRKGDQKLLADVNDFLQKASQDGTFKQIAGRWMALPR
jgi:polar amino acid transport system substrate-binding protein